MRRYLLAIFLLLSPIVSHGQDKGHDFGVWSDIDITHRFSQRFKAGLWIEHRSKTMTRDLDCALLMPYIDYKLSKHFSCNFAYEYVECPGGVKVFTLRPSVSYKLNSGNMSLAIRVLPIYEQTYGRDDGFWRLRTRCKIDYKIPDSHFTPYASCEIFSWENYQRTRFLVGNNFTFGKRSGIDLFYMCQVWAMRPYPRHIIGIGYTINI